MKILTFILFIAMIGCQQTSERKEKTEKVAETQENAAYPDLLAKAFKAHGGLNQWKDQRLLEFQLRSLIDAESQPEYQVVDLQNRKIRIEGDTYQIGMDGKEVWVAPNKDAFKDMPPRFYHNLYFYFFAMPFVFADEGILYEDLGDRTVNDKTYRALKISYEKGVGDTDEDLYIAHFDPETFQMELLLYTVTYFSGETHENYNAIVYSDWQEVDGLLLPKTLRGYKYADGGLGDERYGIEFSNVKLSTRAPDQDQFEMPEKAEIDSLPQTLSNSRD